MAKLLPCPLCGGNLIDRCARPGDRSIWWPSSCDRCEVMISVRADSFTEAITKLNRRPSDDLG